ncbi:uncharacterized protein [Halyomorpha halys]|uniref:uncharacterized protein isoform X2 n=1 Tax=Halyomorpha halys TaxID=286706 RepID=UPI0006D511F8
MDLEADKEVTPDSLEDMVRSLKEGYQVNKRLLYRLEQMLHMSKLPSTVRHFATVVREFFDDVMKSVLDMMGMVTELLKEYSHLIQVHYGMQMGEELRRVKDIFLVECEPIVLQSQMSSFLSGCLRVIYIWEKRNGGQLWMTPETAMRLVREHLHEVVRLLKLLVAEIRGAHCNLSDSVRSVCTLSHMLLS